MHPYCGRVIRIRPHDLLRLFRIFPVARYISVDINKRETRPGKPFLNKITSDTQFTWLADWDNMTILVNDLGHDVRLHSTDCLNTLDDRIRRRGLKRYGAETRLPTVIESHSH
jgi:hypothetical protein